MKSEEDERFDDFLRKAVGNYKAAPPPSVWKNILERIPAGRFGRYMGGSLNIGLIALVTGGALLTSLILYRWTSPGTPAGDQTGVAGSLSARTILAHPETPAPVTPVEVTKHSQAAGPAASTAQKHPGARPPEQSDQATTATDEAMNDSPRPGASHRQATARFLPVEPVLAKDRTESLFDTDPARPDKEAEIFHFPVQAAGPDPGPLAFIRNDLSYFLYLGLPLTSRIRIMPDPFREKPRAMKLPRIRGGYLETGASWSAGLYYYPEWLGNSGITKYAGARHSGGVSVTWKKAVFTVETGLGIMQEDAFQYYDYQYNELIGTYNDLVSISFDTTGGQVVPTFLYKTDSVFDPADQTLNKKNPASYTYLQIPVLFGIERGIGRSGISLRTGPVLSFEVSGKEELYIPGPDMKIIKVGGDHGSRMQTTWQWYLGLGYQYYLTDKCRLFLEPALRTYMETPYNRSLNKKENPLYLGIRAGVSIQLSNAVHP